MTAINFPDSPSNGDTHQGYTYNSTKGTWTPAAAVTSFTGLSDTPSTLGTAGQIAKVNSGATALEFADQSGVTVYANVDALPGTGNTGDLAFVTATNRLYIWNGSGWYNIALINTNPTISGVSSSYDLATDGTATTVTITATDPEGLPITYSIASDTSGNIATVTQGTGASSNVFTITPSTNDANAGTFSLTFRASDGVNIASSIASFELAFRVTNSNYTTALITSVGTNNQVNNTFVDSSTNSHTITAAGDATQMTFSPYRHGGYSAFFGTGVEYLSVAPDASFTFGTGDFTIEGWAYLLATGDRGFFQQATSLFPTSSVNSLAVQTTASGTKWAIYAGNTQHIAATATYSLNQWYHWAMVRESSVTKLYIDGVEVISISDTTNYTGTYFGIGQLYGTGVGNNLNGYLSDVRVIKGTALYTSAFTPPTERLTAVANTSLLTCHLPYFVDGSTNGHTITNTGVTAQPFAPYDYAKYASGTHGGSTYFDGTGDYVTAPSDTSFDFGTGDFTIETWINIPDVTSTWLAFISRGYAQNGGWRLYKNTGNNNLRFYYTDSGTTSYVEASSTGLTNNTWHHIAVVRNSSTTTIYVDGVSKGSGTISTSLNPGTYAVEIGSGVVTSSYPITGNMADVRIVKGTAVYTSTFTPPTAPLTAITNTSLLLSGTNAGIIDKSQSVQTLTLNGNVSSSTTQSKYLTSSMYFDGSGDYISTDPIVLTNTEPFTIEMWYYNTSAGTGEEALICQRNSASPYNGWRIYNNQSATNQLRFYNGTGWVTIESNLAKNQWHHIAVVSQGSGTNQGQCYLNGTAAGSAFTTSSSINHSADLHIGTDNAVTSRTITGYLSDVRITKGLARYTANFTPPTAELKG